MQVPSTHLVTYDEMFVIPSQGRWQIQRRKLIPEAD